MILALPIRLVDGRTIPYRLFVQETNCGLSVREEATKQLPSFCPERHINVDGSFCLFFPGVATLVVADEASANAWVETVYKFLKLQERARVMRKWPNNQVWAHGSAARHQHRAQVAASSINADMARALESNRLSIKHRRSKGRPILELWIEEVLLYRVWESSSKVINQKQRCFCGKSGLRVAKKIRGCADHAKRAADLVLALRDWSLAEEDFWKSFAQKSCCGTCDHCPLKSPANKGSTP